MNGDLGDINGITKLLKNLGVFINRISKTVKHKVQKEGGLFGMLLGSVAASMLEILELKRVLWEQEVELIICIIWINCLVLLHPLINMRITQHFNYKPRFRDAY